MAEPTDTKSSEEPPERKSLAAAQEELVAINKVGSLRRLSIMLLYVTQKLVSFAPGS